MITRKTAHLLSQAPWFRTTARLWETNQRDWNLPLSKWQKLMVGTYLVLQDYANGVFPPIFDDREEAYRAEIEYFRSQPGVEEEVALENNLRKPFWSNRALSRYFRDFADICRFFDQCAIHPPQSVLELGCGMGWMAEFLALMKYSVCATTIAPQHVRLAESRIRSMQARGLTTDLEFRSHPMETIHEAVQDRIPFDTVFVYEALHHAFDWRQTVRSAYACLKPGGWFLICKEPNWLHTAIAYRVARLSNTREIGFRRSRLQRALRAAGFRRTVTRRNRRGFFWQPHWLAAER